MMRVAVLSESSADEAAIRVLVDAILGEPTVPADDLHLESRGFGAVRKILPAIVQSTHYRTSTDGLVVVVDSNHTSLLPGSEKNRLRELRELVDGLRPNLRPVKGRVPLRVAIGVAAPAIEAWLLCHRRQAINEAAWEQGLRNNRDPYSKLSL